MDLIKAALPAFLKGAENTIIYCVSSFALALLLGLILALMNSSRFVWLKTPARIFIEIIRSTPIITQLCSIRSRGLPGRFSLGRTRSNGSCTFFGVDAGTDLFPHCATTSYPADDSTLRQRFHLHA